MSTNKKNKSKKIEYTNLLKNEDYEKPTQTFSERLTTDDIVILLADYKEATIDELTHGVHIRYMKQNEKTKKLDLRMGGIVFKKDENNPPKFIMVSNGKFVWSVQTENTIFYKRMSIGEKEEEFKSTLAIKDQSIKEYLSLIKELEKKNKLLEIQLENNMKDTKMKDKLIKEQEKIIKKLQK